MQDAYKKQVALLIDVLHEVAKEDRLALHGGTAINLFHLDMPRFSVDIDLTYIPYSDSRNNDLNDVRQSLDAVKNRLKTIFPHIHFKDERRAEEELKLLCIQDDAIVKVEVNQINRGLIAEPCTKVLCNRAEEEFNRFCEIKTVSVGQLWGGKVNAALERQHPRDIFDIKNMLQGVGFTEEIKQGFLFLLLCGKRPIDEVLNPNFVDQRVVFKSQFAGMTDDNFSYADFEKIRADFIPMVGKSLTNKEKDFLLSFVEGKPNWQDFDYSSYPAVKWKLININRLKEINPTKHKESVNKLAIFFTQQLTPSPMLAKLMSETQNNNAHEEQPALRQNNTPRL
ncbi:MAG: nucleotidyl transferase AbiEii/AbiGii toxin family protein [Prevotellaceae bacterium]|jgi:predicted nucleotidyltransferase component of viral defense system|nr:nucleotidyl transferase AbiEii/AbiGii toxin family protein [Prevotellaceae bacterium]